MSLSNSSGEHVFIRAEIAVRYMLSHAERRARCFEGNQTSAWTGVHSIPTQTIWKVSRALNRPMKHNYWNLLLCFERMISLEMIVSPEWDGAYH